MILILLVAGSFGAVRGPYNVEMTEKWISDDGLRETAKLLYRENPNPQTFVFIPNKYDYYTSGLYFDMLTNYQVSWIPSQTELAQLMTASSATNERFYALIKKGESLEAPLASRMTRDREFVSYPLGTRFELYRANF